MLNRSLFLVIIFGAALGCKTKTGTSTDIQETAQQIGDLMASIDEMGGNSGTVASSHFKSFFSIRSAEAARCAVTNTYGACSGGSITRTFNSCTVGSATFSGTVALTWSNGASCALGSVGENITRVPNFSMTGRRGLTLTVSKAALNGQVLTWSSGSGSGKVFTLTSDGIRRVFTGNSGTPVYDFTTSVTSGVTITGTARTSRVINGGTVKVKNNLSGVECEYAPSNVAWISSCNCPTSGSWSGTCSDGKNSTIQLDGCGTGTLTIGSDSETVAFDRCSTTS